MNRIQRKRTKGWKMPPNTVYVGRPTKYGNPFTIAQCGGDRESCIDVYKDWIKETVRLEPDFLNELKNKNLACWCPLDQPCHADVLLELANGGKK